DQSERLLNHFSHLKNSHRFTIGVLLGGDAEDVFISEEQVRILCHQLKEVSRALKANILLTTSRRTPEKIEHLLHRELKKFEYCPLLILANQENYPEAVGGIMGLADVIITSGDSISMMSEAASSGKTTLVFLPELKAGRTRDSVKHVRVVNSLHQRGFIVSVDLKHSGQVLYDVAKGKVKTKTIDDAENVYQAVRKLI
ncbi:MAG: mitochondrial fission ELM1 family protein, partial [Candidatus Omnitrophica bacterium]|nr:mitochondrial fission ELM1 family protein [Candidatus Omnitrophota bacterium]